MSKHKPEPVDDLLAYPDTRGERMIKQAREDFATDKITEAELEEKIQQALDGDAAGWPWGYDRPPPTYECPWCHTKVTQDWHNFNWWCPSCGKNATDHKDWDGAA